MFYRISVDSFLLAILSCHEHVECLVLSRILIGLIQNTTTTTIIKTILTRWKASKTCTQQQQPRVVVHMGRLSASATASWVIGPTCGAVLYKHVDERAPLFLASIVLLVNVVVTIIFVLPKNETDNNDNDNENDNNDNVNENDEQQSNDTHGIANQQSQDRTTTSSSTSTSTTLSFLTNLKTCFSSSTLTAVICASLVVTWVTRATGSNNLTTFYEELYGLEPHYRGYISSYQQVVGLVIQSFCIAPVMKYSGGERQAICAVALLLTLALVWQTYDKTNLHLFWGLVCPVTSLAYAIMFTSLQTLVTTVTPVESIFSVLAAMDVMQNAVSVTVPFYRTMLFAQLLLPGSSGTTTTQLDDYCTKNGTLLYATTTTTTTKMSMQGDPDPGVWLMSCTIHWFLASIALGCCLLYNEPLRTKQTDQCIHLHQE